MPTPPSQEGTDEDGTDEEDITLIIFEDWQLSLKDGEKKAQLFDADGYDVR